MAKKQTRAQPRAQQPPKKIASTRLPQYADVVRAYLDWGSSHGGRSGSGWAEHVRAQRQNQLAFWQERLGLQLMTDLSEKTDAIRLVRQELMDKYNLSRKTADEYRSALVSFTKWAHDHGYIAANPIRRIEPLSKRPGARIRKFTRQELRRLLATTDSDAGEDINRRLIYLTAAYAGLMVHELRALEKHDLDAERGTLMLREGEQVIPLWLADELQAYAETDHAGRLYSEKANKNLYDRLLYLPGRPQDMIYRDMADVGIPRRTNEGMANMRSLRATYLAMLDKLHLKRAVRNHLARVRTGLDPDAEPPSYEELSHAVDRLGGPPEY